MTIDFDAIRERANLYAAQTDLAADLGGEHIEIAHQAAHELANDVGTLLAIIDEYTEYEAYRLSVFALYKDSRAAVRPLTYQEWQPQKHDATAWVYAVPTWQDEQAAQTAADDAGSER